MTFAIYDANSGGTTLWTETQTVAVANGIYHVLLGSNADFSGLTLSPTSGRWLGVKVGDDAEMTPRYPLTGTLYARRALAADSAVSADLLDGFHASDFAPAAGSSGYVRNQTGEDQAAGFRVTGYGLFNGGRVGIGTIDPWEPLHLHNGNSLITSDGGREQAYQILRLDLANRPKFSLGRLVAGGDGSPEFRAIYSDDATAERSVFEFDSKGIVASVKPEVGSHFEGFLTGESQPRFRLNSFPSMQLEFGAGGSAPTDVALRRVGAGTLAYVNSAGVERLRITDMGWLGFEGATANGVRTTLTATDPTSDRTISLPDASGTIVTTGNLASITQTGTITSGTWRGAVLDIGYGGTGSSLLGSAGSVAYSTGASYAFSAAGSAGHVLHSNGINAPVWGALNLETEATGLLPVSLGGTGLSASGSAGRYLRSNGSAWESSTIQLGDLPANAFLKKNAQDTSSAICNGILYNMINNGTTSSPTVLMAQIPPNTVSGGAFCGLVGISDAKNAGASSALTNYGVDGRASGRATVRSSRVTNYGLHSYVDGKSEALDSIVYNYAVYGTAGASPDYGSTYNCGVFGAVSGSASLGNYAVQGLSTSTGTGNNYGVYEEARGATRGFNYGVYGTAANGGTNWAGYFNGNVNVTGALTSGAYGIKPPIAYAYILSNATVNKSSGNVACSWNAAESRYYITITGESYVAGNFVTVVTPSDSAVNHTWVTGMTGALVVTLSNSAGTRIQGEFQFVTFKP